MPRYANGYAIRYILSCKEEGKGINKKVGRDCVDVYHNVRLNGKKTKQKLNLLSMFNDFVRLSFETISCISNTIWQQSFSCKRSEFEFRLLKP